MWINRARDDEATIGQQAVDPLLLLRVGLNEAAVYWFAESRR